MAVINAFAPNHDLGSRHPVRVVTVSGPAALHVFFVSLIAALAAGCSGGEGGVGGMDAGADAVVTFPQHDAPLGTDNGGRYYAGQLVIEDGCLRVEVPADANGPRVSRLLIWPSGFAFDAGIGAVRIMDGNGRIAAHAGDHVRLSHATASYQEALDLGLIRRLHEDCAGPFYLVGDEVTPYDPGNEATELRLSDPDVLFLRKKTLIATSRAQTLAAGGGELVLDGGCLRLKSGSGHLTHVIWPAGFTPHVHKGVVQVRNGAGRIIAQVGDELAMGGGYFTRPGDKECAGDAFSGHSVKVLPDVPVYFPKRHGTLAVDDEFDRFTGTLVLKGKCLKVDDAIRIRDRVIMPGGQHLLIWPDTFTLSLEEEVVGIADASGRIVARVGDEIQFSAVSISYRQAMEHSGLEEITPACTGGYWVVGEDFAAMPDEAE